MDSKVLEDLFEVRYANDIQKSIWVTQGNLALFMTLTPPSLTGAKIVKGG